MTLYSSFFFFLQLSSAQLLLLQVTDVLAHAHWPTRVHARCTVRMDTSVTMVMRLGHVYSTRDGLEPPPPAQACISVAYFNFCWFCLYHPQTCRFYYWTRHPRSIATHVFWSVHIEEYAEDTRENDICHKFCLHYSLWFYSYQATSGKQSHYIRLHIWSSGKRCTVQWRIQDFP